MEFIPRRAAARETLTGVTGSSRICVGVRSGFLAWARAGILGVPSLLIVVRRGRGWKIYLGFGFLRL